MNEAKEFAHWIIKATQEVVTIGTCRRYCGKVLNIDELWSIWHPTFIEKQICQGIREWFPELWNDKTDVAIKLYCGYYPIIEELICNEGYTIKEAINKLKG